MLSITIPAIEQWDERTQEFVYTKTTTLQLEHSLVSLSKWEARWGKPFLTKTNKTHEETLDYIRCMTITQNVKPEVYNALTEDNLKQIYEYINEPMTATTFSDSKGKGSREVITAELIYYWMSVAQIPFECQKWHLNRLITLIRTYSVKNAPTKKMSRAEIMRQNAALNAARCKQYNTKG